MKTLLAYALMMTLVFVISCKKSEEQPEQKQSQTAAKTDQPQPPKRRQPGRRSLKVFQEQKLVATIPVAKYNTLLTKKIKVNENEVDAVLLSELLQTYKLNGKNIIIGGPGRAVTLTWDQATNNEVYVYIGGRNRLQIYDAKNALTDVHFPANVVRITASDRPGAARAGKDRQKSET